MHERPQPPILMIAGHDVVVFADVEEAQTYVEAIDVWNEEYDLFDCRGLRLRAAAAGKWDPVTLYVDRLSPAWDIDRVRDAVVSKLRLLGWPAPGSSASASAHAVCQLLEELLRIGGGN